MGSVGTGEKWKLRLLHVHCRGWFGGRVGEEEERWTLEGRSTSRVSEPSCVAPGPLTHPEPTPVVERRGVR